MTPIIRVAILAPLPTCLDYLPNQQKVSLGMRVEVPLKSKTCVGIVVSEEQDTKVPTDKLKQIIQLMDKEAVISASLLSLLKWVARYYHYPLAKVLRMALPRRLCQARPLPEDTITIWQICRDKAQALQLNKRAPKQHAVFEWLSKHESADKTLLDMEFENWRGPLKSLEGKGLVLKRQIQMKRQKALVITTPRYQLNADQQRAVAAIAAGCSGFSCTLLDGVTGSGKTEVYLVLCELILKQQKQVLVLVPAISLTVQTVAQFRERFGQSVQVFHSGLAGGERLRAWNSVRDGTVRIVVGTRSAAFLAFAQLGLIIVDEEHDSSYKQNELLRYHGRDVLVKRAQLEGVPIVLGSATPALETLRNAKVGRYRHQRLTRRVGTATMPRLRLIDVRGCLLEAGLSQSLIRMIEARLAQREQVLLFINRRGYAPLMMCRLCGTAITCRHCDAYLVYHKYKAKLGCHHCGSEIAVPHQCPQCCSHKLEILGVGTQRIEEQLRALFPSARILRIDTDAVRRKGELSRLLGQIHSQQADIIVGTQILSKGHHFPTMTLTAVIDVDQGLFSIDFRGTERLAQMLIQVAGRSGRGDVAGDVVLQTHHPEHPLLRTLLSKGYSALASELLRERRRVGLPPYCHFTLLRVEALQPDLGMAFLNRVERLARLLAQRSPVRIYPPVPAAMEKRFDYYRFYILFASSRTVVLSRYIAALLEKIEALPVDKGVRWHFDVDPSEIN